MTTSRETKTRLVIDIPCCWGQKGLGVTTRNEDFYHLHVQCLVLLPCHLCFPAHLLIFKATNPLLWLGPLIWQLWQQRLGCCDLVINLMLTSQRVTKHISKLVTACTPLHPSGGFLNTATLPALNFLPNLTSITLNPVFLPLCFMPHLKSKHFGSAIAKRQIWKTQQENLLVKHPTFLTPFLVTSSNSVLHNKYQRSLDQNWRQNLQAIRVWGTSLFVRWSSPICTTHCILPSM